MGKNVGAMKDSALSRLRNETIGFVMQDFALISGEDGSLQYHASPLFRQDALEQNENTVHGALWNG